MRNIKSLFSSKKGQFTIVALLATFMVLVTFVVLYPVLKLYIDSVVADMDIYSGTLLKLTPFFILITITLTVIYMSLPVKG